MRLPELIYKESKTTRQTAAFRGLNLSENTRDGELRDSLGLTTASFPCLTTRKGREALDGYRETQDIFAWDKLLVVDGSDLKYDGKVVGNVTPGKKQIAVVNTKLCIFPDKKYLDLESREFKPLNPSVTNGEASQTTFTENSVEIEPQVYGSATAKLSAAFTYPYNREWWLIQTYTSVSWSADAGWTLEGAQEIKAQGLTSELKAGDIVMLRKSDITGNYQLNTRYHHEWNEDNQRYEEETQYGENDPGGFYAVITKVEKLPTREISGGDLFASNISFNVISANFQNPDLAQVFSVGDRVTVTCTADAGKCADKAVIQEISGGKLTFTGNVFTNPGTELSAVSIERPVPDLDFICESDNRLWGVCNADKTVYASALGDPGNFYVFDGLSTDSYAVAVGSEGAFTAIYAFSTAVLCWKENKLHKILGSFPAEYAMYDYDIAGVQPGSSASLQIINEVLYYKGVFGVYAYTGATPTLLSYNLGTGLYTGAAGGTDGVRYYLSMLDAKGESVLLAYDTIHRLWMKEDSLHATAFATLHGVMYLVSGGTVFRCAQDNGERVEWMAELVPFTEDTLHRKRQRRLLIRLDLDKGAYLRVEVREDRGQWREVYKTTAHRAMTVEAPLRPIRCDRFSVRLSGKGGCTLRAMERQYAVGSEV